MALSASAGAATREELAGLSERYGPLFAEIRGDLEQLVDNGRMSRALRLSEVTGERLNATTMPAFFFGDLDAAFVLVHLNPKQPNYDAAQPAERPEIDSLAKYYDAFRRFGEHAYGPHSSGEHKSQFDHKQIRFLRPFDVIEFGETTSENLRRVVDCKLQLELVPYGSSTFSGHQFPPGALGEHFERVMNVIAARPRRYVIFCGAVFANLLPAGTVIDEDAFHLTKADGSPSAGHARFATLRIPWKDGEITAGLAHTFAKMGINMSSYGEAVRARYPSW
jgi:hypothetical protein